MEELITLDVMDPKNFLEWLSIIFEDSEGKASTLIGAPSIYYYFVKEGKLVNKSGLSQASFSRIKTRLIKEGFIYKGKSIEKNKDYLIALHPKIAINFAAYKHLTDEKTVREHFGDIIEELESAWQKNFGSLWKEKSSSLFPVEGWVSNIAYGNLIGWILAIKGRIGSITFLTPHLKLLKTRVLKDMLQDIHKEYGIKYEFLCLKEEAEQVKGLNFNFWILKPEKLQIDVETERASVFYDKKGQPILGFIALKQKEIERYVGMIYHNESMKDNESINGIHRKLNAIKEVSELGF